MTSLLPLALRLQAEPKVELLCLGFTTARKALTQAGLKCLGTADMLQSGDQLWLQRAEPLLEQPQHPAVDQADALAYYALGLKDLATSLGLDQALALAKIQGRHCFEPVQSCRQFLQRYQPDLLITSTCPRSELALQKAAYELKTPSLAVGDLFLQDEASYVCAPEYATHLSVIAEPVRMQLQEQGCRSQIHIGGNPAFDALFDPSHRQAAQAFRHQLGLKPTQRLLLWACHPAGEAITGRQFVDPCAMLALLEAYAQSRSDVRLLIRQHPSAPLFDPGQPLQGGWICPAELPIEVCLHAIDQVVVENSTVGLQAALLGKPLVTLNAAGNPPYAELGLALDVPGLEALPAAFDALQPPDLAALGYPLREPAAARLERLCLQIMEIGP